MRIEELEKLLDEVKKRYGNIIVTYDGGVMTFGKRYFIDQLDSEEVILVLDGELK